MFAIMAQGTMDGGAICEPKDGEVAQGCAVYGPKDGQRHKQRRKKHILLYILNTANTEVVHDILTRRLITRHSG